MSEFDLGFEEQVVAKALQDEDFIRSAHTVLIGEHFVSKQHGWIWDAIRENWRKHRERMTPKLLLERANRDFKRDEDKVPVLEVAMRLFKLKVTTAASSLDVVKRFARFSELQGTLEASIDELAKGNIDKAEGLIRQVSTSGTLPTRGIHCIRWMEEFNDRLEESKQKRMHPEKHVCVKTGIAGLDNIIDGLQGGELGLVIGSTGRGKSITLNHLGYQGVIRGNYVLHVSLEMPAPQVAMRYDTRFIGMLHRKFKTYDFTPQELDEIAIRVNRMRRRLENRLKIVSLPVRRCDMNAIRELLEQTNAELADGAKGNGGAPKRVQLLIIDSADHIRGNTKYDQMRLEQADVYWDLKGLSTEEGVPIWTSTQAGKEWEEKQITRTGAASESYDKERIADVVVTINPKKSRTRASAIDDTEPEAEAPPIAPMGPSTATSQPQGRIVGMDMFLVKYRDGESRVKIPLETDFSRMLIREADVEESKEASKESRVLEGEAEPEVTKDA